MPSNVSYEQAKQVAKASRESGWELPSFGRELFLTELLQECIPPGLQLGRGLGLRVDQLEAEVSAALSRTSLALPSQTRPPNDNFLTQG